MGAVIRNGSKKWYGSALSTLETETIRLSIFYFLLFPISSVISPQEIVHTSAVPIAFPCPLLLAFLALPGNLTLGNKSIIVQSKVYKLI